MSNCNYGAVFDYLSKSAYSQHHYLSLLSPYYPKQCKLQAALDLIMFARSCLDGLWEEMMKRREEASQTDIWDVLSAPKTFLFKSIGDSNLALGMRCCVSVP